MTLGVDCYDVGLKTFLKQLLSKPVFYGDFVL